ncbi:reverse transcriptase domain-containing protein [Chromobacterium aquaticum]|uniref:Reverse transcriptase domain-containing protein n=1 Tax=Chromobacterium aquaticum TaxID=467180 RepID=A0ABV9A0K1_9NEIS|nr:reverse transcriptase domain-containing protein [Chromobacterium aquaticum]MCD5360324.1 hypothetical protein [Chromobacterium aquaticum]
MNEAIEYSFENQFSPENLFSVYREHIKETNAIGIDRLGRNQFELQLNEHVGILHTKTISGSYKFSQYREKLISKGANKLPRVISIPTFRDRIALRVLCNSLNAIFKSKVSLKIPQLVINELKESIKENKYSFYAKLDIQNFYPSINQTILFQRFDLTPIDERLKKLISSCITTATVPYADKNAEPNKRGVPQGLSISNILAELYLSPFDEYYKNCDNIKYLRYVDDILILTNEDPSHIVKNMIEKLKTEFCLDVHPLEAGSTKTTCGKITDSFFFLGYKFRKKKCLAKIESIKRLEDSLADIFTTHKYKIQHINQQNLEQNEKTRKTIIAKNILMWRLNLRITGCIFEKARKGWVFYFSQIDEDHLEQLWKLDGTISNLLKRFNISVQKYEVRSFVRTYYETKRKNLTSSSYIPNFDTESIQSQRRILSSYFGVKNLVNFSDSEIQGMFLRKIRKATKELESDIQDIS